MCTKPPQVSKTFALSMYLVCLNMLKNIITCQCLTHREAACVGIKSPFFKMRPEKNDVWTMSLSLLRLILKRINSYDPDMKPGHVLHYKQTKEISDGFMNYVLD